MGPRRQLGLSITFVDDDTVMHVPGVVEKEPSPSRAVAVVTPPSDELSFALYGLARPPISARVHETLNRPSRYHHQLKYS